MLLKKALAYVSEVSYIDPVTAVPGVDSVMLMVLTPKGTLYVAKKETETYEDWDYDTHTRITFHVKVNEREYSGKIARTVYRCLSHQYRFDSISNLNKAWGSHEPEDYNLLASFINKRTQERIIELKELQKIVIDHNRFYELEEASEKADRERAEMDAE